MPAPPPSNAPTAIDVGKTIERCRAAWAAGRADEAEMVCQQVLAVWPGQTDATYLLGLMACTFGNLDLAVAHVREACRSPRAPAIYFSDLPKNERSWRDRRLPPRTAFWPFPLIRAVNLEG